MLEARFYPPDVDSLIYIINNMREGDKREVMASHGHTPEQAICESLVSSHYISIGAAGEHICGVFGVFIHDILAGKGSPWLLGTDNIVKYKDVFLPHSRDVVANMLEICPKLENYCSVDNKVSIRWLKWLGFEFDEPQPMGINGELFHRFHLER